MTGLMYVPIVLSILVLGAHFLRSGSLLVVFAAPIAGLNARF